MSHKAQKYGN